MSVEKIQNTEIAVIDYNVTEAALAELKKKHVLIAIKDKKDLALVQSSITELTKIRVGVERKRVELKADALAFGRKVDDEAKRVTALLAEIEKPLVDEKKKYNDEQERIAAEEARKEKERVDTIMATINGIAEYPLKFIGKGSAAIQDGLDTLLRENENSSFDFQEFIDLATKAKESAMTKFADILKDRLAFEAEQAAELERQKKAEADRIILEKAQEKFREEQRIFAEQQAEAKRIEDEKAAVARREQEAADNVRRAEELKRQAEENARLAEIEKQRLEVERQQLELAKEKAAHEAKVLADKAQQQSLITKAAPDLLAALESVIHYIELQKFPEAIAARAAINKARGL